MPDKLGFTIPGDYVPEVVNAVWRKATVVEGRDYNVWRRDRQGELIKRSEYGNDKSPYGWKIAYHISLNQGGKDEIDNYYPIHHNLIDSNEKIIDNKSIKEEDSTFEFPYLDENKTLNNVLSIFISTFCGGAVLFVFSLVTQSTLFNSITSSTILVVLLALTIFSIIFYFSIVVYIRESKFGRYSSGSLSVFLVLLIVTMYQRNLELYSLITVGVLLILLKSFQLYKFSKQNNMGVVTQNYFRKIVNGYSVIALISLIFCGSIDVGLYSPFGQQRETGIYNSLRFEINKLVPMSDATVKLDDIIATAENEHKLTLDKANLIQTVVSIEAFVLILYLIIKLIFIRQINKLEILNDLESYYSKTHKEARKKNKMGTLMNIHTNILTPMLIIIRPFISSLSGLISAVIYIVTASSPDIFTSAILFFTVFFASAYGFIMNDIHDINKDKIVHPNRVLPTGRMKCETAKYSALLFFSISLIFSFYISYSVMSLTTTTLFLLTFYSFINDKYGAVANLITSLNTSFVFLIGMLAGDYNTVIIMLMVSTFFLIFSREIILDIRDMHGDKTHGKKSIPISSGVSHADFISTLSLIISSVFMLFASIISHKLSTMLFIGFAVNLIMWSTYIKYLINHDKNSLQIYIVSSRFAFVLVIPAIIFG